jgi:hypothetical protein
VSEELRDREGYREGDREGGRVVTMHAVCIFIIVLSCFLLLIFIILHHMI